MRQTHDGDIQRFDRIAFDASRSESESSSSISTFRYGTTPSTGRCVFSSSMARPGAESSTSPRNLLMTSPDARTFVGFQQRHRAVQLGEHAAPVDIARQQHRRIHQLGKPHVHDVVAFRLISAGLPAPSMTMTSFSAARLS